LDHCTIRLALERRAASDRLENDQRCAIDIGTPIDLQGAKLLRRHVGGTTEESRGHVFSRGSAPEVKELDRPIPDHDVRRLDLAMDRSLTMYTVEHNQELLADIQSLGQSQAPLGTQPEQEVKGNTFATTGTSEGRASLSPANQRFDPGTTAILHLACLGLLAQLCIGARAGAPGEPRYHSPFALLLQRQTPRLNKGQTLPPSK
jgi:hypothetical protein